MPATPTAKAGATAVLDHHETNGHEREHSEQSDQDQDQR
jgi:hypothetical protein